ncbi:MAG: outer rane lipoprotein chaperone LolA [Pseudomonadota bacterium]|jgi:outer membrane lipoprotein carrier protein
MKWNKLVFAGFLGFTSALVYAEEPPTRDDLEIFMQDLKSLHADFTQQVLSTEGTVRETSTGKVDIERPGKFYWEYEKPYRQTIVANGEKIWVYDKDLAQVTIKSFKQALGSTPALLFSSGGDLNEAFDIEELESEVEGTSLFELIPKDEQAQFESMYLNFVNGGLQTLELHDNLGQTSTISFLNQQRNVPISPELFNFQPPAGVDLIDGTK